MRYLKYLLLLIFLSLISITSFADLLSNPFAMPRYSLEYSETRDPFADSRNAMTFAQQTGRYVLIEVGGNWCQWCHILDKFIREHDDVAQMLQNNFVLLKVNVSEENKNEKFMAELPPVDGYPYVFITDAEGHIKFAGDLTPYSKKDGFSEKKFMQFLQRWKPKQ